MPLTIAERKHRLPHGASRSVARAIGVDPSFVTKVMAGEVFPKTDRGRVTLRRVQVALARHIGEKVGDVFPEMNQEAAPAMAHAP